MFNYCDYLTFYHSLNIQGLPPLLLYIYWRSRHQRCSIKKVFLKISQNSQENTCARVTFLIKLQASACNFIKKATLAQVFSCEFCEILGTPFLNDISGQLFLFLAYLDQPDLAIYYFFRNSMSFPRYIFTRSDIPDSS